MCVYIYIYIYTHIYTHTYTYIYDWDESGIMKRKLDVIVVFRQLISELFLNTGKLKWPKWRLIQDGVN